MVDMQNTGSEGKNSKMLIVIGVVVLVTALIAFYYLKPSDEATEVNINEILEEVTDSPTAEDVVPETNPFGGDSANTNPFENYKNPFE